MADSAAAVTLGGLAGALLGVCGRYLALREMRDEPERAPAHLIAASAGVASGLAFPLILRGPLPPWHGAALWALAVLLSGGDASYRVVPNVVAAGGIAAALAVWLIRGDAAGAVAGSLFAGGVMLPGVLLRQMGAGDLKAAAALGAVAGWPLAAYGVMAGVLLGGIAAVLLVFIALLRRTPLQNVRRLTLPYVVPLSAGFVLAAVLAH